jgi:hypothetical protein
LERPQSWQRMVLRPAAALTLGTATRNAVLLNFLLRRVTSPHRVVREEF